MSGHTPGPWVVKFRDDGSSYISMGDPKSGPHKQFDLGLHSDFASDVADARVFEAAPKMLTTLAAVERRLAGVDGLEGTKEIIRAAIARATGEQP